MSHLPLENPSPDRVYSLIKDISLPEIDFLKRNMSVPITTAHLLEFYDNYSPNKKTTKFSPLIRKAASTRLGHRMSTNLFIFFLYFRKDFPIKIIRFLFKKFIKKKFFEELNDFYPQASTLSKEEFYLVWFG